MPVTIDLPADKSDPEVTPGRHGQPAPESLQRGGIEDSIMRVINEFEKPAQVQQTPEKKQLAATATGLPPLKITVDTWWKEIETQLLDARPVKKKGNPKPNQTQIAILKEILNDAFRIHTVLAKGQEVNPFAAGEHAVPEASYSLLVTLETLSDLKLTQASKETLQALLSTIRNKLRES